MKKNILTAVVPQLVLVIATLGACVASQAATAEEGTERTNAALKVFGEKCYNEGTYALAGNVAGQGLYTFEDMSPAMMDDSIFPKVILEMAKCLEKELETKK